MVRARTGKAEPAAFGIAQVRGDRRLERRRANRLQQARLRRAPQIAGIHGNEHVRRARGAFRGQALDERRAVIRDGLHFDAPLLAVLLEQRFDQLVLARGVHHEGLASGLGGPGNREGGQGSQRRQAPQQGNTEAHGGLDMVNENESH